MLLIVVERGLREYLEDKVFEFNDATTRSQIAAAVDQFLRDIQVRRGLYDYNVIVDESNNTSQVIDNNEMYVDVYLKPTKVAEFITGRVIVTSTGSNFSEIQL
jgi:phage tail sheath protein FI